MRSARLARGPALLAAATSMAALLAGCGPVSGAHQVIDRSHLVNQLASRLDRASTQTYTADYDLGDGAHGTVAQAQKPVRASYSYADGKIVTTLEATIDCRAADDKLTCTVTPPQRPTSDTTVVFNAMGEHGLVPPQVVIGLLTAASFAPKAQIRTSSRTIAGENASCVDVHSIPDASATDFAACITDSGVLGSFDGVLEDLPRKNTLVRYSRVVADDAFDAPEGAVTVDERPTP
jgi:hypothetical protein